MKKKLESELVSIAHRILKLTGKEDLEKMQEEVALLYQKISILKFFDGHIDDGKIKEGISGASFFNALDGAFNKTVSDSFENEDKDFVNTNNNSNDAIVEPATEKIKDIVAQMPQEANAVDKLVEEINDSPLKKEYEQLAFADDAQLPIFDPVVIEENMDVDVTKLDDVLLQFGRVGDDEFHLDFRAPMTAFQAMGIVLAQFNF